MLKKYNDMKEAIKKILKVYKYDWYNKKTNNIKWMLKACKRQWYKNEIWNKRKTIVWKSLMTKMKKN